MPVLSKEVVENIGGYTSYAYNNCHTLDCTSKYPGCPFFWCIICVNYFTTSGAMMLGIVYMYMAGHGETARKRAVKGFK